MIDDRPSAGSGGRDAGTSAAREGTGKARAARSARKEGTPKRTPSQRRAAEALQLTPEEQAARWKAHSGASDRLLATHAALDRMVRARFPAAQDAYDYNMRGWAIRRPVTIETWKGTLDPNWIRLYVAERKQGITIHVWSPYDPSALQKSDLGAAGFKVMVGCVQFHRGGEVPVEALAPLLDDLKAAWAAES